MAGNQGTISGSGSTAEEVVAVKARFGTECKIITDVGEFSHVVDIKLQEHDGLSIKFQVPGSYPAEPCHVIARSRHLDAKSADALAQHMASEAATMAGKRMMEALVDKAIHWLQLKKAQMSNITKDEFELDGQKKKDKKPKKKSKKKYEEPEVKNEKKPSMKTAEEVINRIMWDDRMPTDCFIVGYLDRFLGIIEKNFTWFSWEDLASVDYDTLAIPKHRIEYFKYKDVIVWEKKRRLDNVFGSVGGRTIYDVMDEYEENAAAGVAHVPAEAPAAVAAAASGGDDDSDDDSDDGIRVNVGAQAQDSGDEDQDWDQYVHRRDKYWGPKNRPTHFIALRVTNPDLVDAMHEIHEQIRMMIPEYKDCILPTERMHVTLACLGLDTQERIDAAAAAVNRIAQTELQQFHPGDITVEFDDVKQFFNQTLYAQVKENRQFLDLVEHLRQCIREAGIEIRDIYDFTPHMTILKLSRQLRRDMHCPYLDGRMFEAFGGKFLGTQKVDNIYLCEMSEERTPTGFYVHQAMVKF